MSAALRQWLLAIGLEQYADKFAEQAVDLDILPELSDDDLAGLGLPLGHRRKLQKALRETPASSTEVDEPDNAEAAQPAIASGPERRQLTVMFCDLVGSVALGERMELEDYRELLAGFRACVVAQIERYDGFVARHQGDGVLAYFGYPQAHEDDAERAVRAALGVVDAVRDLASADQAPLCVRSGIATGTAVVGDLLETLGSSELAALGPTPNLAARLQGTAKANEIVVSATTYQLTESAFAFGAATQLNLKGIEDKVTTYTVTGDRRAAQADDPAVFNYASPLVGRSGELALLTGRWEQCLDGLGHTVLVSAEPGVGKSRLLREFRASLDVRASTVISLQCSAYHSESALYPVVAALDRVPGLAPHLPDETRLDALERFVGECGLVPDAHIPLLASLLSINTGQRYAAVNVDGGTRQERVLQSLTDMVVRPATGEATLLLAEDLHWADSTTIALLERVVARSETSRVMVVLSARPGFEPPWRGCSNVSELRLGRLSSSECEALAQDLCARAGLDVQMAAAIVERTDGVPLFIEELCRFVADKGSADAIPVTLHDALTARLDQVGAARTLAQAAAVIGRSFDAALLPDVSELPSEVVQVQLQELLNAGLIIKSRASSSGTDAAALYHFKHALIRDSAYASLLREPRRRLHERAAIAHENNLDNTAPAVLAHHWEMAGCRERSIHYWQQAAALSSDYGAVDDAITHFEHALELAEQQGNAQTIIAVTNQLAMALRHVGRRADAMQRMRQHGNHIAAVEDGTTVTNYYRTIAHLHAFDGELADAEPMYARAMEAAKRTGDDRLVAAVHGGMGWVEFYRRHFREALANFTKSVELFDRCDASAAYLNIDLCFSIYGLSSAAACLGQFDLARACAARFAEIDAARDSPLWVVSSVELLAARELEYGDIDAAIELLLDKCNAEIPQYAKTVLRFYLGWAYLSRGDVSLALPLLEESRVDVVKLRGRNMQIWILLKLCEAYLDSEQLNAAAQLADECRSLMAAGGVRDTYLQLVLAHMAFKRGKLAEARTQTQRALERASAHGERPRVGKSLMQLARIEHADGCFERASACLRQADAMFADMCAEGGRASAGRLADELGLSLTEPV